MLLRALEPLEGIDFMQGSRAGIGSVDLARGPGRLSKAIQVELANHGADLCGAGSLWLAATAIGTGGIGESARIELTRNIDPRCRFYERGNPHVSGPGRLRE